VIIAAGHALVPARTREVSDDDLIATVAPPEIGRIMGRYNESVILQMTVRHFAADS
jgi:hypothetical protein